MSQVLYVELIDDKGDKISFQQIKLDDGRAAGTIENSYELNSQLMTLRAYTSSMRNFDPEFFYRKAIQVIGKEAQEEDHGLLILY